MVLSPSGAAGIIGTLCLRASASRSCMRFCIARSPACIVNAVTLVTLLCAIDASAAALLLVLERYALTLPIGYFFELAAPSAPIMPVLSVARFAGVPDGRNPSAAVENGGHGVRRL